MNSEETEYDPLIQRALDGEEAALAQEIRELFPAVKIVEDLKPKLD